MHAIRVVVTRIITLVVVPYLAMGNVTSRRTTHSSSSLHLHVCECMDAGIDRPLPFSCRVRRQLTRTDMTGGVVV